VSKKISGGPEKSSGVRALRDECHVLIAQVAGERSDFDTRELWLERAAERAGLSIRTIKAMYYGELTERDTTSLDTLREAARRYEIEDIAIRFEQLAARVRKLVDERRVSS
jgi:hypothetical protein